ncbi:hypothetical protein ACFQZ4_26095 [Catellatospora coxensis]
MKHAIRTRESDTDALPDAPMDDLVAGLAKAKRGPWLTRSTGALLGLVLTCGGFLAGIQVQQNFGTSGTAATPGGATGARPNGFRVGNNQGGFGGQQGAQPGPSRRPPPRSPERSSSSTAPPSTWRPPTAAC